MAVEGWVNHTLGLMSQVYDCALEELLVVEAEILENAKAGVSLGSAPAPSKVPNDYPTLLPGQERKLQTKLNLWDSFQTATGLGPALLRFLVSTSIAGGAIYVSWMK